MSSKVEKLTDDIFQVGARGCQVGLHYVLSAVVGFIWAYFLYKYSDPEVGSSCYAVKVDDTWIALAVEPKSGKVYNVGNQVASWCFWGFLINFIFATANLSKGLM